MAVFSRAMRRWRPIRIAVVALGLAWLAVFGAFIYADVTINPTVGGIVAALAAFAIAGAGILYAWREPGR